MIQPEVQPQPAASKDLYIGMPFVHSSDITKVAGVHVSCTDAKTQTDETCIAELKSATSNAGSKPTLAPPLSGMAQIKMGVVPSTSTPCQSLLKQNLRQNLLKRSLRRTQKTKSTRQNSKGIR